MNIASRSTGTNKLRLAIVMIDNYAALLNNNTKVTIHVRFVSQSVSEWRGKLRMKLQLTHKLLTDLRLKRGGKNAAHVERKTGFN